MKKVNQTFAKQTLVYIKLNWNTKCRISFWKGKEQMSQLCFTNIRIFYLPLNYFTYYAATRFCVLHALINALHHELCIELGTCTIKSLIRNTSSITWFYNRNCRVWNNLVAFSGKISSGYSRTWPKWSCPVWRSEVMGAKALKRGRPCPLKSGGERPTAACRGKARQSTSTWPWLTTPARTCDHAAAIASSAPDWIQSWRGQWNTQGRYTVRLAWWPTCQLMSSRPLFTVHTPSK